MRYVEHFLPLLITAILQLLMNGQKPVFLSTKPCRKLDLHPNVSGRRSVEHGRGSFVLMQRYPFSMPTGSHSPALSSLFRLPDIRPPWPRKVTISHRICRNSMSTLPLSRPTFYLQKSSVQASPLYHAMIRGSGTRLEMYKSSFLPAQRQISLASIPAVLASPSEKSGDSQSRNSVQRQKTVRYRGR